MRTDAQLIRDAANDPEAFAELYRRHVRSIHRWIGSRVPEALAGELVAETFAQAALSLRRFRDEAAGSAAPWLYGIAKNLVRRYYERERVESDARRRLGMPIRSYEQDFAAIEERVSDESLRTTVRAALDALPRSQREAVELRVVQELNYEQVGQSLGCSEGAARLRVMRGLNSLSRSLGKLRRDEAADANGSR